LTTALAPNSNLKINGGILESSGTFTRSLGTGGGSVQWLSNGGFSARGGTLTVNIAGMAPLTWGTGGFVGDGGTLKFSASSATDTVIFRNPINFGALDRVIEVANGSATIDAELSGTLSSGGGGLTKTGTGALSLTGNNTYTGTTTISGGTLVVNGSLASGSVIVAAGSTLGGSGTLAGATQLAGTSHLSPGMESAGRLTFGTSLTLADSFVYDWQLGVSSTDRVDVATLDFGGSGWKLNLGLEPDVKTSHPEWFGLQGTNAVYTLFSFASATGLGNLTNGVTILGNGYWNTDNAHVTVQGNNVVLSGVWLIPEPNVLVLWISSIATIYAARRRTRRKKS
jgi:autotransporter-associated beta strand protein